MAFAATGEGERDGDTASGIERPCECTRDTEAKRKICIHVHELFNTQTGTRMLAVRFRPKTALILSTSAVVVRDIDEGWWLILTAVVL